MRVHNLVCHFKVAIGLEGHFTLTLRMPKMVFALDFTTLATARSGICSVTLHTEDDRAVKVTVGQTGI